MFKAVMNYTALTVDAPPSAALTTKLASSQGQNRNLGTNIHWKYQKNV